MNTEYPEICKSRNCGELICPADCPHLERLIAHKLSQYKADTKQNIIWSIGVPAKFRVIAKNDQFFIQRHEKNLCIWVILESTSDPITAVKRCTKLFEQFQYTRFEFKTANEFNWEIEGRRLTIRTNSGKTHTSSCQRAWTDGEHMPRLPVLGRNEAIKFNQIFSYKVH